MPVRSCAFRRPVAAGRALGSRWLCRALFSLGTLWWASAGAADPAAGTAAATNQTPQIPSLQAQIQFEGGPGFLPAYRAHLTAGTNRFAFLIPPRFRLWLTEQQRVQMVNADQSCVITVQIHQASKTATLRKLGADSGRQIVLQQFPGANILDESTRTIGGGPACDYTFEWVAAANLPRRTRTVLVETRAGILELSVDSSPSHFDTFQRTFNTILLTLVASDANGHLNVAPLSSIL